MSTSRPLLIRMTSAGLYCEAGGFHIDPSSPVAKAVITHAHADHAVRGSKQYLTAVSGRAILAGRMGAKAAITALEFGQPIVLNGVRVSLHPAGHILGSAQIRVEYQGEVWVASGDYKVEPDPTCEAFEPVRCDTFITESTFAHPRFAWPEQSAAFAELETWWRSNQERGVASFVYAYALGKAQRVLAGLNPEIGPLFCHPNVEECSLHYRRAGRPVPAMTGDAGTIDPADWGRSLIVLPPGARFKQGFPYRGHYETSFASGWMLLPNGPKSRRVGRGFVLSDHADRQQILTAIAETGAERVFVMHGYIDSLVEELRQRGLDAHPLRSARCTAPPDPESDAWTMD
ncbi:ligase-associated DNA damage response exonuclease [Planctellipticum variicoloris]|uniref:ligase-associated DNA damage response exonuclease n=1 Tax=Planctellipticum variicoloris TaxID=3064265 RepID=UPI0030136561|nr:ligase-associated DNA damage response exonuclease [Planctomycetaceae bacterium SH412]